MSAAASRWAWAVRDITPTQKLVLVCLADHAGKDGGNCFPAIARVASECCLSERAVQYAMRQLAELGLMTAEPRPGRSTLYSLPIEGCNTCTPAPDAPVQEMQGRGATGAGEGCISCTHNHKEPSINHHKEKSAPRKKEALDLTPLPSDIDPDIWADFVKVRNAKKKPLTDTAVKRLATQLERCRAIGFPPNESLGLAVERNWVSVDPDWMPSRQRSATPRLLTDA